MTTLCFIACGPYPQPPQYDCSQSNGSMVLKEIRQCTKDGYHNSTCTDRVWGSLCKLVTNPETTSPCNEPETLDETLDKTFKNTIDETNTKEVEKKKETSTDEMDY